MEESKNNYLLTLEATNKVQRDHYEKDMPAIFSVCVSYCSCYIHSNMLCILLQLLHTFEYAVYPIAAATYIRICCVSYCSCYIHLNMLCVFKAAIYIQICCVYLKLQYTYVRTCTYILLQRLQNMDINRMKQFSSEIKAFSDCQSRVMPVVTTCLDNMCKGADRVDPEAVSGWKNNL